MRTIEFRARSLYRAPTGTKRSPWCTTVYAVQASSNHTTLLSGLVPLFSRCATSGPAFTCRCVPGDNLALHRALVQAPRGSVLVCDTDHRLNVAYFGELMALDARYRGLAGLVIDGTVRDVDGIERVGFPVFCSGLAAVSSLKQHPGSIGSAVRLRRAPVRVGDYVIADRDGVVVVPGQHWHDISKAMREIWRREQQIRRRINEGQALFDILGLPDGDTVED